MISDMHGDLAIGRSGIVFIRVEGSYASKQKDYIVFSWDYEEDGWDWKDGWPSFIAWIKKFQKGWMKRRNYPSTLEDARKDEWNMLEVDF